MILNHQLKKIPQDFQVKEALFFTEAAQASYYYYKLKKSGYTTFEAVKLIAKFLQIDISDIGYAGLKDEDGITEQHISCTKFFNISLLEIFNKENSFNDRYIKLSYITAGEKAIKVGELLGNYFHIIIRNLEQNTALYLSNQNKYTYNFINYYGPQRFGLPNAERLAPMIGKDLINGDYLEALIKLSKQHNFIGTSAKLALEKKQNPKDFFYKENMREQAFYRNSYYSENWNCSLKEMLKKDCRGNYSIYQSEGIEYLLLLKNNTQILDYLPYKRIIVTENQFEEQHLKRQVQVQVNLIAHSVCKDIYNPGKYAATIELFLPSGCYATVTVDQLIFSIEASYIFNSPNDRVIA